MLFPSSRSISGLQVQLLIMDISYHTHKKNVDTIIPDKGVNVSYQYVDGAISDKYGPPFVNLRK